MKVKKNAEGKLSPVDPKVMGVSYLLVSSVGDQRDRKAKETPGEKKLNISSTNVRSRKADFEGT